MKAKSVVLGITGSIAAYKAADIASQLTKRGYEVRAVMTAEAQHFITPLTIQTLSRQPVVTDLFDEKIGWQPGHIDLADNADLLAHRAGDRADHRGTRLGFRQPRALRHRAGDACAHPHRAGDERQDVAARRDPRQRGTPARARVQFIGPEEGLLACGYEGVGRLWPVDGIVEAAGRMLADVPAAQT